ncbi:hypothetical protein GO986_04970 [Deinococcus sp. HMF7620]|uniref:Uncharacterized protein n=1 Tax=Deinococcus arboris TaxID=2682977 RepID=A0A7C9HQF2_9DEIO|nr:hypothetical protein [Deinococcus arboris]MVN86112.1 hypothetical protein [Deinococcus arboris]
MPLLAAYLGAAGLVALLSLWQLYQPAPFALPLGLVTPAICTVLLLAVLVSRRPNVALTTAELGWLRSPTPPWAVLAWPLLRTAAPWLGAGLLGGAALLAVSLPAWPVAAALPGLAAAVPVLQAASHAQRLTASRRVRLLLTVLLPLLGPLHPLGLMVGGLLTLLAGGFIWKQTLRSALPPRLLRLLEVQAVQARTRRLGLPLLAVNADGLRPARRWTVKPPVHPTPARILLWRATLPLLTSPAAVLPTLLGGLALAAGLPGLMGPCLAAGLRGLPALPPPAAPVPASKALWWSLLPSGLTLGTVCAVGALLAGAHLSLTFSAGLASWLALAVFHWLGGSCPTAGAGVRIQLELGAGLTPGILTATCVGLGLPGLAPLALLGLGLLALLVSPLT